MERRKRWQLFLIVGVLLLTVYNILPTIFFYSKPLDAPVNEKMSKQITQQIASRVDAMESDSVAWVKAFAANLGTKPAAVAIDSTDPRLINVTFADSKQARVFKKFLPRAGALIPFVPAQLALDPDVKGDKTVVVERQVGTHFDKRNVDEYFQFSTKRQEDGLPTDLYRSVVSERFARVAAALGGVSEPAKVILGAANGQLGFDQGYLVELASQIVDFEKTFGIDSPITKRFYASFTQVPASEKSAMMTSLSRSFDQMRSGLREEIDVLVRQEKQATESGQLLELASEQKRRALERQAGLIKQAQTIVSKHRDLFEAGKAPLTSEAVLVALGQNKESLVQSLPLSGRNPFVQALTLDWENEKIGIALYPDVEKMRDAQASTEVESFASDKLSQLLINQVAYVTRVSDEVVNPSANGFSIALSDLSGSESFLALNLGEVARQQLAQVANRIDQGWNPSHADLSRSQFPIYDYATFQKLSAVDKKLGLVTYAPAAEQSAPMPGFRANSTYVIARGIAPIAMRSGDDPALADEFVELQRLMRQHGYVGFLAADYGLPAEFKNDYVFEKSDYYADLLSATREEFTVRGAQKNAILEFTDYKQRLLTQNEIDTQIHEDLQRWRDEYRAAQVDINSTAKFFVPKPTKSVVLDNLKLSAVKYFRGDNRKILKWGLDLSGGKTVTIGLLDQNGRRVTTPAELEEGANQLYTRVNKMGVSEVEIRTEGDNIVLNFPGAQGLSAAELVQGSQMFFHIVNEKFAPQNSSQGSAVTRFLQEVWNEAVVTNRKDLQSINEIAWQNLGGDLDDDGVARPRSEAAQTLFEAGLRVSNPYTHSRSSTFDDTFSSIAMYRGDTYAEWQGQSNPLMIVFANYALAGTEVEGVHAQYDPSKGNLLVFGVSKSGTTSDGERISPQANFYTWTSQFAEDKIAGTPLETVSGGRGWRMAVVLNDQVISAPNLINPLKDSAMVTGHFSQRQVNQLVADFKAGSLTFTPKILSERNVSPELGLEERTAGIVAAIVGLVAVIALMTSYYRFAGVVASIAVVFNLLIMWGVLQNLDAALTLPGIAGIILTIGMAVDANVLVFERIREEFSVSGRIASAVHAGYKKAFTAIFDSNLTTIIAAIILMRFDAGPIRGFAVTIIIGIVSSMFTALFMTRYFFAGWVLNPKHDKLKMVNVFDKTNFDFIRKAKPVIVASLVVMVIGCSLVWMQRTTMFGMDFTGGYALNVSVAEQPDANYRKEVADALVSAGVSSRDIQVRELNRPNQLRIQLGMGMEQQGGAFYQMPEETLGSEVQFGYEKNPRIVWVVNALAEQGIVLQPSSLAALDSQWNVMSGQFSNAMRNNAMLGLGLALLAILIYITFRFEFKYAISAIIALVHDLVISIGALAILHWMGLPVQIDLQVVGALMTIIGYSLNDTIIIFDRIREDGRILRKLSFKDLVNHALNATLNRTLMTSGTTLVVLLALVILGGSAIFDFSLVMTLGVIFGTFSSLFIASPVLLFFHNRETVKHESKANAVSRA